VLSFFGHQWEPCLIPPCQRAPSSAALTVSDFMHSYQLQFEEGRWMIQQRQTCSSAQLGNSDWSAGDVSDMVSAAITSRSARKSDCGIGRRISARAASHRRSSAATLPASRTLPLPTNRNHSCRKAGAHRMALLTATGTAAEIAALLQGRTNRLIGEVPAPCPDSWPPLLP
jgi:hypothetical protein